MAAGAGQTYFGHDEYALIAPGMKTIDDALELRRRIYGAFELAESTPDENERRDWLTVAVVGAGPTGVELAGQVRELAVRSLRNDFRSIDPTTVRVVLLDGGEEPLANFGDKLSGRAARELEKMGVELRMRARVVGVDAMGVDVEGPDGKERISAHTVIWAAGVQASPLAKMLADATGAEIDRSGRIAVQPDLSSRVIPRCSPWATWPRSTVCRACARLPFRAGSTPRTAYAGGSGAIHREVPFRYRDTGAQRPSGASGRS